jgi:cyclophilin family peptidyl-prolyl cis-trans isomerase
MKKINLILTVLLTLSINQLLNAQNMQQTTPSQDHIVLIMTDFGNIKVKLYNETPKHRDNFLKLAREGFYDSTLFHRVIQGFMIQGGDPTSKNAEPGAMLGGGGGDMQRIPAEFLPNLYHKKGVLAAARDGNPQKASSACQFYIVQGRTYLNQELDTLEKRTGKKFGPDQRKAYTTIGGVPFLDGDYTVYGEVIEGLDVVDKIAEVEKGQADRPIKDVRMKMKVIQ